MLSLLGIIAYIVKLSADYTRLKTEFQLLKEELAKKEQKDSEKFTELYNSRNKTSETLTELTTTLKMLVQSNDKHFETINSQFEKLEKKIDEIKGRKNG